MKNNSKRIKNLLFVVLLFLSCLSTLAYNNGPETKSLQETHDLDFEKTTLDNWFMGGEYKIELDHNEVFHGKQSLRFSSLKGSKTVMPGYIATHLPVSLFRGKRVRLSGALKTNHVTSAFSLWLRADAGEDPAAFNQLSNNSPRGTNPWQRYSVELDIPLITTSLYMGAVLYGEGTAWVDDLSLQVIPALGSQPLCIGGKVQDKEKSPVPHALIAAKAPFHETALACTFTDKDGKFIFHLPAGTYMLTATAPKLTAAVLPSRSFIENTQDLVLVVGETAGFSINGKLKAPPGKITTDSYVVANQLRSLNNTIFYVPLNQDGSFQVTLPTGDAYRLDLDDSLLKAIPVLIQKVTTPGQIDDCLLVAMLPQPAPEPVVSWIKQEAVNIPSIEAGQGFLDLQPLKNIIGNARVVAIGETTHGTREMFQLKHRFLEFLVEEMGFTVLAMEGVEIQELAINDYILYGKGDLEKILASLPAVWSTEEIFKMIIWMKIYNADPSHPRKVKFLGIETGDSRSAVHFLQRYLEKVDPSALKEYEKPLLFLGNSDVYSRLLKYSDDEYTVLQKTLKKFQFGFDQEKANYITRSSLPEWEQARQRISLLQQFVESYYIPGDNDYHYLNLRSRFMAENTRWILDTEPPGTKIMLWAHNFHISLSPYPGYPFIFMGMHLRQMLGNDYLAIGFIFNRGSFQGLDFTSPNKEHHVLKSFVLGPTPGSYGLAMSRTGLGSFFLDLRQVPASGIVHDWFSVPQVCQWVNYIYDSEKDIKYLFQLPRLFDAIIFIDKITRARPLPAGRYPVFPY